MSDWNGPVVGSVYLDVLAFLKARDVDALTLCKSSPTNQPDGSFKYDRVSDLFAEYSTSLGSWVNKSISVLGGGTGATTASGARTNLGLGTMAVQNSNLVTITGGSIVGVNLDAGLITSGTLPLSRGGTGASLGLGANGSILQSNGAAIVFGTDGSQLTNLSATQLTSGTVPTARLGSGTPDATTFLRGDQTWAAPLPGVPTGSGLVWYGSTAPTGYLLCDGSSYLRTDYAALFAIIGVTYGSADSTHFNVPDLRQRFPLGQAASGTGSSLGATGGAIDHFHLGGSHAHTYTDVISHTHTVTDPTHRHGILARQTGGVNTGISHFDGLTPNLFTNFSDGSIPVFTEFAATGISIASTGVATGTTTSNGTVPTNSNNPPYLVVNYIIKT